MRRLVTTQGVPASHTPHDSNWNEIHRKHSKSPMLTTGPWNSRVGSWDPAAHSGSTSLRRRWAGMREGEPIHPVGDTEGQHKDSQPRQEENPSTAAGPGQLMEMFGSGKRKN